MPLSFLYHTYLQRHPRLCRTLYLHPWPCSQRQTCPSVALTGSSQWFSGPCKHHMTCYILVYHRQRTDRYSSVDICRLCQNKLKMLKHWRLTVDSYIKTSTLLNCCTCMQKAAGLTRAIIKECIFSNRKQSGSMFINLLNEQPSLFCQWLILTYYFSKFCSLNVLY